MHFPRSPVSLMHPNGALLLIAWKCILAYFAPATIHWCLVSLSYPKSIMFLMPVNCFLLLLYATRCIRICLWLETIYSLSTVKNAVSQGGLLPFKSQVNSFGLSCASLAQTRSFFNISTWFSPSANWKAVTPTADLANNNISVFSSNSLAQLHNISNASRLPPNADRCHAVYPYPPVASKKIIPYLKWIELHFFSPDPQFL